MKIHPAIDKIQTSSIVKSYFNKLELYKIIEDIVTVDPECPLNEANNNWWPFSVDTKLKFLTPSDIKAFYEQLIHARKSYLKKYHPSARMIFYTWYDDLGGNLCFSLISSSIDKAPFGYCILNQVSSIESIIELYFKDEEPGVIPISEIKIFEPDDPEFVDDEEEESHFILDVYSIVIP